jgi:hypothetical protein
MANELMYFWQSYEGLLLLLLLLLFNWNIVKTLGEGSELCLRPWVKKWGKIYIV